MSLSRLYLTVLAVFVAIIYVPTLWYEFVNIDDHGLIYTNPIVIDNKVSYWDCFRKFIFTPYYKPLVFASWKLEYQILGKGAWHFHLFNVLLHLLNTILVFIIGKFLFQQLFSEAKKNQLFAFLFALLFTVHPFRIESVAWATERKDVLFAFFFLISWYFYLRYTKYKKYIWVLLGALLYVFSGLSKSMGITLVGVLFLTDLWMNEKIGLRTIFQKLPYFISLALLLVLFGFIRLPHKEVPLLKEEPLLAEPFRKAPAAEQITTISYIADKPIAVQKIVSVSMRIVLWVARNAIPYPLSVTYPHNKYYGLFGQAIFLTPFLILACFWYCWRKRRAQPYLFFSFSFYVLTLLPVLMITESGQAIFLSDRYMYIPSLGLFFGLLAFAGTRNLLRYTRGTLLILLIIAAYFVISLIHVGHWRNSGTLFRQALRVYPESGMAALNLGLYYGGRNENEKAMQVYTFAINRNTSYIQIYHNRARIYLQKGAFELAMLDLDKCIALNPRMPYVWVTRARVHQAQAMPDSALRDLDRAFTLDSTDVDIYRVRTQIFYAQQNYPLLISTGTSYLTRFPPSLYFYNLMGLAHLHKGEYGDAMQYFDKAIALQPTTGGVYYNRSVLFRLSGNLLAAERDLSSARAHGYSQYIEYTGF